MRGEIFLKIFVFLRGHVSKRKKNLALKWLKLRIPKDDLLIALILLFMPSHIALLYVLFPNLINLSSIVYRSSRGFSESLTGMSFF